MTIRRPEFTYYLTSKEFWLALPFGLVGLLVMPDTVVWRELIVAVCFMQCGRLNHQHHIRRNREKS